MYFLRILGIALTGIACAYDNKTDIIVPVDNGNNDRFGSKIIASDDFLVVSNNPVVGKAKAYVYRRIMSTESSFYRLDSVITSKSPNSGCFGIDMFVSNDVLYVGDCENIAAPRKHGGVIYAFEKGDNMTSFDSLPNHVRTIRPQFSAGKEAPINSKFGTSIAIEKNLMIVGAPEYGSRNEGACFVFILNETWQQYHVIENPVEETNYFGHSVTLSQMQAIVAAFNDNFCVLNIFKLNEDYHIQEERFIYLESITSRVKLSLNGDFLTVAAKTLPSVFVYRCENGHFRHFDTLTPSQSNSSIGCYSAEVILTKDSASVIIGCNNRVAIFSSYAYAPFTLVREIGALQDKDIDFGHSIAVTPNKRALLIGAPDYNINSSKTGAVFVLENPLLFSKNDFIQTSVNNRKFEFTSPFGLLLVASIPLLSLMAIFLFYTQGISRHHYKKTSTLNEEIEVEKDTDILVTSKIDHSERFPESKKTERVTV